MRILEEIEVAIYDGLLRFEQDDMGRSPKDIRTDLLGDLVPVR
jgi:hypothetical protein